MNIHQESPKSVFILLLFMISVLPAQSSPSTGSKCSLDEQADEQLLCPYLHNCVKELCLHKFVWPPETEEIVGSILLFLIVGLGTAGGIGGVFLIRPILVYLFNYSIEAASQLSYGILFGGMMGGCLVRMWKRDPIFKKPVIHYEVVIVCFPIIMFGANLGLLLNRILPSIIDFLIQMYLLSRTSYMMWTHYKRKKKEKIMLAVAPKIFSHHPISLDDLPQDQVRKELDEENNIPPTPNLDEKNEMNSQDRSILESTTREPQTIRMDGNEKKITEEIDFEEFNLFPFKKYLWLLGLSAIYILIFLFRGNVYLDSLVGIENCRWAFWFIFSLVFPFSIAFHIIASNQIKEWDRKRGLVNYKTHGGFILTKEKLPHLRKIAIMSGLLTSTTGIGVGTGIIPGLISIGLKPYSAICTTSLLVLFVSVNFLSLVFGSNILTPGQIAYFLTLSLISGFSITILVTSISKMDKPGINLMSFVVVTILGILAGLSNIIYRSTRNYNALLFPGNICKI